MTRSRWRLAAVLAAALLSSGCGTYFAFQSADNDASLIYGGVRADVVIPLTLLGVLDPENDVPPYYLPFALMFFDLPFSFVADTVLLPWTVTDHVRKARDEAAP
jgi:uncharacterized protein YceK